jgi:hypothetical protein
MQCPIVKFGPLTAKGLPFFALPITDVGDTSLGNIFEESNIDMT